MSHGNQLQAIVYRGQCRSVSDNFQYFVDRGEQPHRSMGTISYQNLIFLSWDMIMMILSFKKIVGTLVTCNDSNIISIKKINMQHCNKTGSLVTCLASLLIRLTCLSYLKLRIELFRSSRSCLTFLNSVIRRSKEPLFFFFLCHLLTEVGYHQGY